MKSYQFTFFQKLYSLMIIFQKKFFHFTLNGENPQHHKRAPRALFNTNRKRLKIPEAGGWFSCA